MKNICSLSQATFFVFHGVLLSGLVSAEVVLNQSRDRLFGLLGTTPPKKGERRIDPDTGIGVTRLTDVNDFNDTSDVLIVYSRYSPENSDGNLLLVFGSDSNSSWIIERKSGKIIRELRQPNGNRMGEEQEIRWDYSKRYPNRVYFRTGMQFYRIDNVRENSNAVLVKDFAPLLPKSERIYNDVEGDSSLDSDHWMFMAIRYNGRQNVVDAFVHFQISSDKVHLLKPKDLAGTPLDHYKSMDSFSRPNMVDMSPTASGVVIYYSRSYPEERYQMRPKDVGTWFDSPHLWPIDFDVKRQTPIKIAVDEMHSGWAFGKDGTEYFISQNNRVDLMDAVATTGPSSGWDTRWSFARHADLGWSTGFHFGRMPPHRPGWVLVSTYASASDKSYKTDWGVDQLMMIQLTNNAKNPRVFRIGPSNNRYNGAYRDEGTAAINLTGDRVYVSSNWYGKLGHQEVFVHELPSNWDTQLK